MQTVQSWDEALMTGLAAALAMFMGAIPRIIAFLVIILVGWFLASLVAKGVAAVLRKVNFNDAARRSGFADFVHNTGAEADSSGFIALVAKWFIRLIALVVAFDALGVPAVSEVLRELLLWLPNLVVALVVLVIGGLAANALWGLVRGSTQQAGFSNPGMLATIAKGAVWAFAIIIAANQVGIGAVVVNTLLIGFVAALALASGLAFGLGGRDVAERILERAYSDSKGAGGKLEAAAEAAKRDRGVSPGGAPGAVRP
ncbi:MAG: small-conductance mechanosensitive ion channel [Gemmatimonadetes bacterium]|nr:small-conductance mechanosensitive ion channel [Gemmatimonadota bacterium]